MVMHIWCGLQWGVLSYESATCIWGGGGDGGCMNTSLEAKAKTVFESGEFQRCVFVLGRCGNTFPYRYDKSH